MRWRVKEKSDGKAERVKEQSDEAESKGRE